MPKFVVPADMSPGVFRHGVGFFRPGSTIVLPDAASKPGEKPSIKLVPAELAAYKMLVDAHGDKAVAERHGDKYAAPKVAAVEDDRVSLSKAAKQLKP